MELPRIRKKSAEPPPLEPDEDGFKERLADKLIRVCAVFGALAYLPSAYLSWREGLWLILAADSLALALILLLSLLKPAPYGLKIGSLLLICYGLGISLLFVTGPFGAGHLYVFCFVMFAGLFGNLRQLAAANAFGAAGYAAFVAYASISRPGWTRDARAVIVVSANAVVLGAALSSAANFLVRRYAEAASAERRLRRLRESMLKEIDHRVKNNLQMLSSLVAIRSRPGVDPSEALAGIKESLSAVSLVYKMLDRGEVRYSLKASHFIGSLFERFAGVYPQLKFDFSWKGPELEIEGDAGVELGLILDEILMNSVKHAFPGGLPGRVFLRAEADDETRRLRFVVGDEGEGGPDALPASGPAPAEKPGGPEPSGGQGRKIIQALAKQLGAEMSLQAEPRYVYSFDMVLPPPSPDL